MSVRSFFWPTAKPDAGGLARLGRVLHWVSVFLSSLAVAGGLLGGIIAPIWWRANHHGSFSFHDLLNPFAPFSYPIKWDLIAVMAVIAILVWLFGRTVRYVLANE